MSDKIVEATGIKGNDDKSELVVGRIEQLTEMPHRRMVPRRMSDDIYTGPIHNPETAKRSGAFQTETYPISEADKKAEQEIADDLVHHLTQGGCVQDGIPGLSDGDWPDFNPPGDSMEETIGQGADGKGGLRLNAGKNRLELLPEIWSWALADVMTQGAKKYDARNWEKGMDWSSMIGCMHRHIAKFQGGQRYDGAGFDKKEGTTGCHELAMVAWNALALMLYDLKGIGNNDLPSQQLDLFSRVNAETSDLSERFNSDPTAAP